MNLQTKDTDVLIIGAGPAGLMMACQLAISGIPFRIIDKNEDHTSQSRALVVQARSLEIFDQMGVAEKALEHGRVARAIGAFFNGKKELCLVVNHIAGQLTKFPFFLMLEQSQTESILVEFLKRYNTNVERNTELISFEKHRHGIVAKVELTGGKRVSILAAYLVGADGAHSSVREQLGIDFIGTTYEQSLFVLDTKADAPVPYDEMYLTFGKRAVGGLFPLTNGRWRVLGNLPRELEGREKVSFEEIEKNYAERVQLDIRLYDPHWLSVYRTHHRYARVFREGRGFLIGDAAHIHSPVGAQGMNTGLQDAYNLAWKLSMVIKNRAKDWLLDTYEQERITIARELVYTTDRAFKLFTNPGFFYRLFRAHFVPIALKIAAPVLMKSKLLQKYAFRRVSEIGVDYRKSILSGKAVLGKTPRRAPVPGDRLPYFVYFDQYGQETNTHAQVKSNSFLLFVFASEAPEELMSALKPFEDVVEVKTIPFTPSAKNLYRRLLFSQEGCLLVRPDMHIAYRSDKIDPPHLANYLSRFLIAG